MKKIGAYYNENNPYKAEWLRQLIRDGEIADGEVDERSVWDVPANDVAAFRQAHFFAGVGGWSRALRLAGWPDTEPVWTGSAPCQPFSTAGQRKGFADQRHLWPAWFWLIRQCRPGAIFGEQVSSVDGLAWLDVVSSDLENTGYEIGAFDLCAAGAGAPHNRPRLYFVAHADGSGQPRGSAGESGQRPLLQDMVLLAPWPTPNTMGGGQTSRGGDRKDEKLVGGLVAGMDPDSSIIAPWPTPTAHPDGKSPEKHLEMKKRMGERDGTGANRTAITDMTVVGTWATPAARDYRYANAESYQERSGTTKGEQLNNQVVHFGPELTGLSAPIRKPDQLNPDHSRWLMGYPVQWAMAAPGSKEWSLWQQKLIEKTP